MVRYATYPRENDKIKSNQLKNKYNITHDML